MALARAPRWRCSCTLPSAIRRGFGLGTGAATAWLRAASIFAPVIVGVILTNSSLDKVFLFYAIAAYIASFVAIFGIETKEKVLEALSH